MKRINYIDVKRRNLVKSVSNNSLLNANTEGARTTGLGRAFQIGTIFYMKKCFKYIIFCQWYSDRISNTIYSVICGMSLNSIPDAQSYFRMYGCPIQAGMIRQNQNDFIAA